MSRQNPSAIEKGVNQVRNMMPGSKDIASVILQDHKSLKELIQVMKDSDRPLQEILRAFHDFAPLLLTHAMAEEQSLYEFMKTRSALKKHALEGKIEHDLADQLVEEIKCGEDGVQLIAKIKVLAELVEHHIVEEEDDILPDVRKFVDHSTLLSLAHKYTEVQSEIIANGQSDSPLEPKI